MDKAERYREIAIGLRLDIRRQVFVPEDFDRSCNRKPLQRQGRETLFWGPLSRPVAEIRQPDLER